MSVQTEENAIYLNSGIWSSELKMSVHHHNLFLSFKTHKFMHEVRPLWDQNRIRGKIGTVSLANS